MRKPCPPHFTRVTRPRRRPTSTAFFRGDICPPFLARYVYACSWPMSLEALQTSAQLFVGEHDFLSFAATDPDLNSRAYPDPQRNCASAGHPRINPNHLLLRLGKAGKRSRRSAHLSRERQWLPAPHGAQPGGNHARYWPWLPAGRRDPIDHRCSFTRRRRPDCARHKAFFCIRSSIPGGWHGVGLAHFHSWWTQCECGPRSPPRRTGGTQSG